MNKFISLLAMLCVALFTTSALAWTPPASPKPQSAILDQAHVLSAEAHARLDAQLAQINSNSANELAALIVPTLDGEEITDVSDKTANAWGVGKSGLDNGVLVVLAMKEHKSHISTGKGVEGDLPDLKCNDVLQNVMRPHMRAGDVEGALKDGFNAIAADIANHKADVASGRNTTTSQSPNCQVSSPGADPSSGWTWFAILGAGGILCLLIANARKRERERVQFQALREKMAADRRRDLAAESARLAEAARLKMQQSLNNPTPVVHNHPAPVVRPHAEVKHPVHHVAPVVSTAAAAVAVAAEAEREAAHRRAEEDRKRREERDEEDRRRRQREEDDERSRNSSPPSDPFSGGGGGSDPFGGGSFGGGGSSGDW